MIRDKRNGRQIRFSRAADKQDFGGRYEIQT